MATLPTLSNASRLVIPGVHGFPSLDMESKDTPRPYLDPCSQLLPIRRALEEAVAPLPVEWLDCPWILGPGVQPWPDTLLWQTLGANKHDLAREPARLLGLPENAGGTGTFSNLYLDGFSSWFDKRIRALKADADAYIAVLAYSGGGYLLYRYLAERASPDIIERIGTVFCIASPYRFRKPHQVIHFTLIKGDRIIITPGVAVAEPSVDASEIIKYLRPKQLVVLQAGEIDPNDKSIGDRTILTENSSFAANGIQSPKIVEHTIDKTNHLSILSDQRTIEHILGHIREALGNS